VPGVSETNAGLARALGHDSVARAGEGAAEDVEARSEIADAARRECADAAK
jgi:hypothetical protein